MLIDVHYISRQSIADDEQTYVSSVCTPICSPSSEWNRVHVLYIHVSISTVVSRTTRSARTTQDLRQSSTTWSSGMQPYTVPAERLSGGGRSGRIPGGRTLGLGRTMSERTCYSSLGWWPCRRDGTQWRRRWHELARDITSSSELAGERTVIEGIQLSVNGARSIIIDHGSSNYRSVVSRQQQQAIERGGSQCSCCHHPLLVQPTCRRWMP